MDFHSTPLLTPALSGSIENASSVSLGPLSALLTKPALSRKEEAAVELFHASLRSRVQYIVEAMLGALLLKPAVSALKECCRQSAAGRGNASFNSEEDKAWRQALQIYRALHCLLLNECQRRQQCHLLNQP
jgi:hypothetical protein